MLAAVSVGLTAYLVRNERWSSVPHKTPMELVRYTERRLNGHPNLQRLFGPVLESVRRSNEREPPANLPTLGKGQQPFALRAPGFDAEGHPKPSIGAAITSFAPASVAIKTVEQLRAAMADASPGQVLEVEPGTYALNKSLNARRAGLPAQPIVVRAAKPGTVDFTVSARSGVVVSEPFWVFENLDWRGVCQSHEDCDYAFNIVGRARGTVVLNNRTRDFNVHYKVGGQDGHWPDDGLLQYNTISNSVPRRTELPVSSIELIGVARWMVSDNLVERLLKVGGSRISYGMCVKGAAQAPRIERNLVACAREESLRGGLQVGISLGCGTTGGPYCRDGRCTAEVVEGVIANNVIAHCNDFGIDLHRARGAVVAHNTLINTEGIDARDAGTQAVAVGNLVEGLIRARDGARLDVRDNRLVRDLDTLLTAPDALDLRWHESSFEARATPETERDFCGRRRPAFSPPGATVQPRCDAGR